MKKYLFFIIFISLIVIFIFLKQKAVILPNRNNNEMKQMSYPIVIAAAGDIACNDERKEGECYQDKTAKLIVDKNPDIVLALGDLQYDSGLYNDFLTYYDKTWGIFKNKTKPVPGNHDYGTQKAKGYFDYFNGMGSDSGQAGERDKGYYSFTKGNWKLLALNSNCWAMGGCDDSSAQYAFVKKELDKTKETCTIAYWHHPVFSSGPHGNDANMRAIWRLLYEKNVEIVLNGHDHLYERFEKQNPSGDIEKEKGIQEFIVGTGGRNLYALKAKQQNSVFSDSEHYGVLFLSFHERSYDWQFITIDNTVVDSGTEKCF